MFHLSRCLFICQYPTLLIVASSEIGNCYSSKFVLFFWFFFIVFKNSFHFSADIFHLSIMSIFFYMFLNIIILAALQLLSVNSRVSGLISVTSFSLEYGPHLLFPFISMNLELWCGHRSCYIVETLDSVTFFNFVIQKM